PDCVVLDHRIGEQRVGELGDRGVIDTVVHLQFEVLALADVSDAVHAEPAQRSDDRLPLRVEDLWLEDDVDDDAGHGNSSVAGQQLSSAYRVHFQPMRRMSLSERVMNAANFSCVMSPGGAMFISRCRATVCASVYLRIPSL